MKNNFIAVLSIIRAKNLLIAFFVILIDLFLLDEDGKLKYYQNFGEINTPDFVLIDPSFQNINCGGWFYFADFDFDNDLDLMTQNIDDSDNISYYMNYSYLFLYYVHKIKISLINIYDTSKTSMNKACVWCRTHSSCDIISATNGLIT